MSLQYTCLHRYQIEGTLAPLELHFDATCNVVPYTESRYTDIVVAPTAEDAWFMHSRNVEQQTILQTCFTPNGRVWRTRYIPKFRPQTIKALEPQSAA